MVWRHPGDKPLSESMVVSLLSHTRVTRPQWIWYAHWVNVMLSNTWIYQIHVASIFLAQSVFDATYVRNKNEHVSDTNRGVVYIFGRFDSLSYFNALVRIVALFYTLWITDCDKLYYSEMWTFAGKFSILTHSHITPACSLTHSFAHLLTRYDFILALTHFTWHHGRFRLEWSVREWSALLYYHSYVMITSVSSIFKMITWPTISCPMFCSSTQMIYRVCVISSRNNTWIYLDRSADSFNGTWWAMSQSLEIIPVWTWLHGPAWALNSNHKLRLYYDTSVGYISCALAHNMHLVWVIMTINNQLCPCWNLCPDLCL